VYYCLPKGPRFYNVSPYLLCVIFHIIKKKLTIFCTPRSAHLMSVFSLFFVLEGFIAKKACATFARTSYRIVPLNNLNKYLYSNKSEVKVSKNVNNSSEKFLKKEKERNTATIGELIIGAYASVVYVYIFIHISQVG